jgi:hypothetical protein
MTPEILARQSAYAKAFLDFEESIRDLRGLCAIMGVVVDGIVDDPKAEERTESGCLVIDKAQEENLRWIAWRVERDARALHEKWVEREARPWI